MKTDVIDIVSSTLRQVIVSNKEIITLACQQRAKFEGWLKFELAAAIMKDENRMDVIIEGGYDNGTRADIVLKTMERNYALELKTTNSNWRADGLENKTRPIKKNIDSIISDYFKLKSLQEPNFGILVLVIFPIPEHIWTSKQKLNYHLSRIENKCKIKEGTFLDIADYYNITSAYGLCTFVFQL